MGGEKGLEAVAESVLGSTSSVMVVSAAEVAASTVSVPPVGGEVANGIACCWSGNISSDDAAVGSAESFVFSSPADDVFATSSSFENLVVA